mgnify:CR=1 FL=1
MEGKAGAVEAGVVAMVYPVAHIDVEGFAVGMDNLFGHGKVAMTKNEIVVILMGETLLCMDDDAFVGVAQIVVELVAMALTAVVAPSEGDAHADERVDETEEALVEAAAEDTFEVDVVLLVLVSGEFVAFAIAMAHAETLAVEYHIARLAVHDDANLLLQIIEDPHVVISNEIVHLHASIHHLCQRAQQTYMPLGDHMSIGEPKLEDVAQQDEPFAVGLNAVEESHELAFAEEGIGARSQVAVGQEIG